MTSIDQKTPDIHLAQVNTAISHESIAQPHTDRRLYGVLDKHLQGAKGRHLVGGKCTIADIAHWGWVVAAGWARVDVEEFPNLKAWEERMSARPGVEKGRHVPSPHRIKEMLANKEETEKYAQDSAQWIQREQAEDPKKG